jgi:hypothetical protein
MPFYKDYLGTPEKRFWEKIVKEENGCWTWTGTKSGGYGALYRSGKTVKTHRFSYELHKGNIPSGICVCHSCDNPCCCNPDHLFLGTFKENNQDRAKKGRSRGVFQRGEDHPNSKLTKEKVRSIREVYSSGSISQRKLAKAFDVNQSTIRNILKGRIWGWSN